MEPARDGSVCLAALSLLSINEQRPDFGTLWDTLVAIGRDFAQNFCDAASFDNVAEALDYQRSYASLDVSFADDDAEAGDGSTSTGPDPHTADEQHTR